MAGSVGSSGTSGSRVGVAASASGIAGEVGLSVTSSGMGGSLLLLDLVLLESLALADLVERWEVAEEADE